MRGPSSTPTDVLTKRGNVEADTHTEKAVEPGVRACREPPEAGREPGTDPPPVTSEGAWPCRHLGFLFLASTPMRE